MLSRLVLPSALIVATVSMYAFAQSPAEPESAPRTQPTGRAILFEEQLDDAEEAAAATGARSTPTEAAPAHDEQALREQYLQLVREKADLMDRNVLREEISRLERGIEELKAAAALDRTRADLHALILNHPDTPAAATARKMLHAAEAAPTRDFDTFRDAPFHDGDSLQPTPATTLDPTPVPNTSSQNPRRTKEKSDRPTPIEPAGRRILPTY